jgi:cation-transporting P-type ATPase 13A2
MVPIYVVRTGFSTTRGSLIRSILYPKPHTFTFFQESIKFIIILFLFSVIGYCILINRFLETLTAEDMVIKFLDLFTITVPPTLPASLHVGITYSVYRLES